MKTLSLVFKSSFSLCLMCFSSIFLLSSCSSNNMTDLEQYVKNQRNKPHGKIQPLPKAKAYSVYTYKEDELRNPFVMVKDDKSKTPIEVCPQVTRSKTELETVPLDTLTLVGSMEQDGERWALVKDRESIVHRLKRGEYMGQNNGRITRITESEVVLQEMVSNLVTGCQKRQTTLAIAGQRPL